MGQGLGDWNDQAIMHRHKHTCTSIHTHTPTYALIMENKYTHMHMP